MNTPNTPSELLAMQRSEGLSPEACKAIDACVELGLTAEDKRQVALWLVDELLDLHEDHVGTLLGRALLLPHERQALEAWAVDASHLRQAESLLEVVSLPMEGEPD